MQSLFLTTPRAKTPFPFVARGGGIWKRVRGMPLCLSRLQVLSAWRGFVQEQLRKKGRLARAAESYQAELLREGLCRVLRFVAAVKQHRGRLQAQHQLQVKQEPGWETRLSPREGAS